MKATTNNLYILASVFLWIGFVGAISFMEAWLKFQEPTLTLSVGLGIGKLVFNALNKVELVLATIILLTLYRTSKKIFLWRNLFFLIPLAILIFQTLILLPILDARAIAIIENNPVPISNAHLYYVGLEVVKVTTLFIYGINIYKT
ncbi:hypothetical protein H4O18_17315 [Arenibacter sp. BSSL-BM3]|uniref:DUF4149 domain-containing protein n=1 Tax=Arenibacter arenosicollis TaxID=2762274 RepID=A0ABR7QRI1_9FLAO|nr:hypothetical protein [Arenibacter arenosicollis]MBC8769763.1 hypothetical protein [Arenibacter arenosicollis]